MNTVIAVRETQMEDIGTAIIGGVGVCVGAITQYLLGKQNTDIKSDKQEHDQLVELVNLLNNQLKLFTDAHEKAKEAHKATEEEYRKERQAWEREKSKIQDELAEASRQLREAAAQNRIYAEKIKSLETSHNELKSMYHRLAARNEELEYLNRIRQSSKEEFRE